MSKYYINTRASGAVETLDEFDTRHEGIEALSEYRMSLHGQHVWLSRRPTREWKESEKPKQPSRKLRPTDASVHGVVFIQEFAANYLTTVMWCEAPDDDDWHIHHFAPQTLAHIQEDAIKFLDKCRDGGVELLSDLGLHSTEAGSLAHDFLLSRNGHGAGFWDKIGWPSTWTDEQLQLFQDISEEMGHVDYYRGDDGLIYHM